jgi:hypothetical protein
VLYATAVLGFASGNLLRAFRSGSPGTYWVLGAGTLALVGSVVFSWREKRPRVGWWMATCITLPQIASLASSLWSGHKMDTALAYTIGDIVPRIVADGTAELTEAVALADLFSVACAATIAIGFAERRAIPKRVVAVGGVWLLASIVLFVVSLRSHEIGLRPLVPVMVAAMVAAAAMSREDDLAPIAGVAGVIAVCLLERAIAERSRATAFSTMSIEDMAPKLQADLLAGYLVVRSHARVAMGVHVVLGAATFLAARPLPRKLPVPAIAVVAVFAAMAVFEHRTFARRLDVARAAFDVGIPIPTTSAHDGWYVSGDRFTVTRDGTLHDFVFPDSEDPLEEEDNNRAGALRFSKPVLADENLTCGELAAALKPKVKPRREFALATIRPPSSAGRAFAGDLEPLVGDRELVGLGFDLNHHFPMIDAILDGESFVLKLPGETLTFALAVDPEEVARAFAARKRRPLPSNNAVQLTVHASDSVRRLAAALTILTVAFPMESKYSHRYFALHVE